VGINEKVHDKGLRVHSLVVSANDGITTTFAVVAGSLGASLSPSVVLILGFANLFADGLSMATGAYLGVKTEIEFEADNHQKVHVGHEPMKNAVTTFISFVIAGFIPLIPFILKMPNSFILSAVLVVASLFVVGIVRGLMTHKNIFKTALENTYIGGAAALIAYSVGYLVRRYLVS
jgi:VIT1/CCC1 family predicted Fe2+/Mn2+ transporter